MAFVYFGDFTAVNGAPAEAFGHIATAIADASAPICLSLGQAHGADLMRSSAADAGPFSKQHCVNVFYTIDAVKRPVYLRIAAYPSVQRTSVTNALADAKWQMDAIAATMEAYGMADLLAGFVLDNVAQNRAFSDGSYWSRETINQLIVYAHDTYQRGVCCLCDSSVDAISLFTPADTSHTVGLTVVGAELGAAPQYDDWLIHVSPFSIPVGWYNGANTPPNLWRFPETLRLIQSVNIKQAIVQTFPSLSVDALVFDGGASTAMNANLIKALEGLSYFMVACGVVNFAYVLVDLLAEHDDAVNHPLQSALSSRAYMPLQAIDPEATPLNPYGLATIYLDSDPVYIYVRARVNGESVLVAIFDHMLRDVTPRVPTVVDGVNTDPSVIDGLQTQLSNLALQVASLLTDPYEILLTQDGPQDITLPFIPDPDSLEFVVNGLIYPRASFSVTGSVLRIQVSANVMAGDLITVNYRSA
jgi:hypothetical protein